MTDADSRPSGRLTGEITLAGHTAPSRVLFGPHETNLGRRRALSAAHTAYYARRAAGGAGIVVTETASVHPSDWPYERAPLASECESGWRATQAACREHGTLVLAGLGHTGLQGSSAFSQAPLWGPSRVPDAGTRELPMEMEQAEIDTLVAGFASATRSAIEAGLPGVEINAGQHSLLRQFASGLTNQRGDDYGNDKVLLLRQVLRRVRDEVGLGGVLGLRLSCDELAPWAGITPEIAAGYVAELAPLLDYLVVVRGSIFSVPATRPDLHTEPQVNSALCAQIRAGLSELEHPPAVVLQGSVVDPAAASAALDDRVADLVEMTRAQIAEPRLVALLRDGHADRARPCVLSNQRCMVRDNRNPVVSCLLDSRSGHELTDEPDTGTDPASRRVLVVGGGPAGLEAARVLAERGHRVELCESGSHLGGLARVAAAVHGRARLAMAVEWWQRELDRLGVTVRLGYQVGPTDLDAATDAGTAVLLATGSRPGPRGYAIDPAAVVIEAADLLQRFAPATGTPLPDGDAVVFDPIGGPIGVGIAELLAAQGKPTAIVTQDQIAGTQLAMTGDLAEANSRLQRAGVRRELRGLLREVGPSAVVLEDCWTAERREVPAGFIVHCGHRLPEETLYEQRPGTPRAGDCVAPRTIAEAVLEGRRQALALAGAVPRRPSLRAMEGAR